MKRFVLLGAVLLSLGGAFAARAEDPAVPRDSGTATSPTTVAPRVRATHRVDVIAPGEKVESVIDRMRAQTAAAVRDGRAADAPATAAERRGDRGGMDQRGAGMPSGGSMTGGPGPMPGGMPGVAPGGAGPRTDGMSPDHMRRR